MDTVKIQVKSSGPLRRAGLEIGVIGKWVEHEIEVGIDGFKKLLMLAEDSAMTVNAQDEDGNWHALPAPDVIQGAIDRLQEPAPEAAQGAVNTILPTAEPTLEREPEDTTGDEAAEEPQPLAPDPAQNAAGTGGQEIAPAPDAPAEPSTPAPEAPAAQAEGEAKAEPEA